MTYIQRLYLCHFEMYVTGYWREHVRARNCSLQRRGKVGRRYSAREIIIIMYHVGYEFSLDILARGQSWSVIWGHASRATYVERHPGPDIRSRPP